MCLHHQQQGRRKKKSRVGTSSSLGGKWTTSAWQKGGGGSKHPLQRCSQLRGLFLPDLSDLYRPGWSVKKSCGQILPEGCAALVLSYSPSAPSKLMTFSSLLPSFVPPTPDNKHSSDRQRKAGHRPCAILVRHTPLLQASWTKSPFEPNNRTWEHNFWENPRETQGTTPRCPFKGTYRCFPVSSSKAGGRTQGMVLQPSWLWTRLAARC